MFNSRLYQFVVAAALVCGTVAGPAWAQSIQEDFEGAAGDGGVFFSGSGSGETTDWDSNLVGEEARVSTSGRTLLDAAAQAAIGGGISGNGGQLLITNLSFDIIDEGFGNVSGNGGGIFLEGDGATPNVLGFTTDWDQAIQNEAAFAGTNLGGTLGIGATVSAEGVVGGGIDSNGGGRIIASDMVVSPGTANWFGGLQFDIGPLANATPLLNPGFEDVDSGWTFVGNVFPAFINFEGLPDNIIIPRSGAWLGKMFGSFAPASPDGTILLQTIDAQPTQTWQLDAFVRHNAGDSLVGTSNTVIMKILFLDDMGMELDSVQSTILASASPEDTWIDVPALSLAAPAGTVSVQPSITFIQFCPDEVPDNCEPGAAHIDDVSFKIVSGPSPVDLSLLNLTADVRGTVSGGGQVLGDYQLRIEDSDGNRLVTTQSANGNWQSINLGDLTEFVEADANGVPSANVFNENSANYRIVVAYDNDGGNDWGTGGTLEVDNLFLNNTTPPDTAGSEYAAELSWNELGPITAESFVDLSLSANVLGSVPGGEYELRLECAKTVPTGGLLDFEDVTGTPAGGENFFGGLGGGGTGEGDAISNTFDDGLAGGNIFAYGGSVPGVIMQGEGVTAEGVVDGGDAGFGDNAVAVTVDIDALSGEGGWFAGLRLDDVGLASTDLSQVTLTAMVQGTTSSGPLGEIELRLLDGDGDRLFFCAVADGTWQPMGGTLDNATLGAAFCNGCSNGFFDLDSESYRVEVAFSEETAIQEGCDPGSNAWTPGTTIVNNARLTIDDLFLSPVDLEREVGRATFAGTADGGWQTIGGPLLESVTDFGGFKQDLDDIDNNEFLLITEADLNGCCTPSLPWHSDVINENAVFGVFGSTFDQGGTATFTGCTDCGVDGTPGGEMTVQNMVGDFYFTVVFWENVRVDLSAGAEGGLAALADVVLEMDVKGTIDLPGQSDTLGEYILRVESEDLTSIAAVVQANGDWQHVGGSLADPQFEIISVGGSDLIFDWNQPAYTVTIALESPTWVPGPDTLSGQTIAFDNLFMTGEDIADAEVCSVVLSMDDALSTWGSGDASLTIDNINLGEGGSCPGGTTAECGDVNGDSVRDDACSWYACEEGLCSAVARITQADIGGGNGACPIDGTCDGNDRFHALNCFSNSNTTNDGLYPCESSPPSAVNVDAGGQGISCVLDGVCDGNDAFHALNCFSNVDSTGNVPYPCSCNGPQPESPATPSPRQRPATGITLVAPVAARPGDVVDVEVYFEDALDALRGYQLHAGIRGGRGGSLELIDMWVDSERKDYAFSQVAGAWDAFNLGTGQLVVGMDDPRGVPSDARAYVATLTYRVPKDASGTFTVDLRVDESSVNPVDRTFLFGANAAPLSVSGVTPASIDVGSRLRHDAKLHVSRGR